MMFIHSVYQLIFDINENGATNIITFILEMPSALDWQWMINMSIKNQRLTTWYSEYAGVSGMYTFV